MLKEDLPLNKTFNVELKSGEIKHFNVPHGNMWKIHSNTLKDTKIQFETEEDATRWKFFSSFGQDPYSDGGTWIPQDISFYIKNESEDLTIIIDELLTQK